MSMSLPDFKFHHQFRDGLRVILTVKREENKKPMFVSSIKDFQNPANAKEYRAWTIRIAESLMEGETLTQGERDAISVHTLTQMLKGKL